MWHSGVMIIVAVEQRSPRPRSPRYVMETENGELLGYANLRDDLERNALALADPGDSLRIELADGSVEEIEL